MNTRIFEGFATAAALGIFALSALAASAEPYGPTSPEPSPTASALVVDDGTWTIETMLADRHALSTPVWWEHLF